jgi:uncharacterized protein YfaA (DUF2138 family)
MRLRRRPLLAAAAGLLAAAATLVAYRSVTWARFDGDVDGLALDLARPDALVRTTSLTQLPRDLLKVPLARDVLSEDLLFYYEEHPDRLGLKGSLRRIAYEHELSWGDELLAWALDQPAEVALWRDGGGRLRHWLLALSRPQLVKALQEAATVALKSDTQLSVAGELAVEGAAVKVLALRYAAGRTLLVAGHGPRVVVLSEPGMLLGDDGGPRPEARALVEKLLLPDAGRPPVFGAAFQLDEREAPAHSVVLGAHYLSFGYQRFFPSLRALRFDFGWSGWSTQVLLAEAAPAALAGSELWAGLPANPAACALLPVDWSLGQALVAGAVEKAPALAAELEGPAAVCWYGDGRLQAPLFAALLRRPRPELEPVLTALFGWGVRAAAEEGEEAPGEAPPQRSGSQRVWQRTVADVPFAALNDEGEPVPGDFEVTLGWRGRYVFFSPDGRRVEQALATAAKRYPSVADTLPAEAVTLGVLSPPALARLGKEEAAVMLPRGQEPVFRDAAERLLWPRLEALGRHPAYRLVLPAAAARSGWQPVEWQEAR